MRAESAETDFPSPWAALHHSVIVETLPRDSETVWPEAAEGQTTMLNYYMGFFLLLFFNFIFTIMNN